MNVLETMRKEGVKTVEEEVTAVGAIYIEVCGLIASLPV